MTIEPRIRRYDGEESDGGTSQADPECHVDVLCNEAAYECDDLCFWKCGWLVKMSASFLCMIAREDDNVALVVQRAPTLRSLKSKRRFWPIEFRKACKDDGEEWEGQGGSLEKSNRTPEVTSMTVDISSVSFCPSKSCIFRRSANQIS